MNQFRRLFSHKGFIAVTSFVLGLGAFWGFQKTWNQPQDPMTSLLLDSPGIHGFPRMFSWSSSDPFKEMHRMEEQFFADFAQPMSASSGLNGDVKVHEDNEYVYYEVPVADVEEKDVKVQVDEGQVTISGKSENKKEEDDTQAFFSSAFHRSFPLPANVDPTDVKIDYGKDKVTIKFPKSSKAPEAPSEEGLTV